MAGALIGALRVSLSAETSSFEAGMSRAQATAKRTAANINTSFSTVGRVIERSIIGFATALSLGAAVRAGKAALDYAGHLGELADTLGLTTKDLQEFSYAAGQVGISQDELESGIQKLTISMGKAEVGSKAQIKAFQALGISISDIKGQDAGEVFRLIADKLQNVGDRSQRAAIEVALFGKAGAKLDNLLSGSQGRLDELSNAAQKLGIVLGAAQIRKADETADKLQALQTVLKAQIAGEVAENADAILSLANALSTLVRAIGQSVQGWKILIAEFKAGGQVVGQNFNALIHGGPGGGNAFTAFQRAGDDIRRRKAIQGLPGWFDTYGKMPSGGGTGQVGDFLAGGGGGRKKTGEDLERKQLDALRKLYDYQRTELDAQKDILEAKKDLASDYVEQTSLSIDILNLERQQYQADLANQVAENAITKGKDGINQAQADHLLALYDQADHDKRAKVLDDEQEHRLNDIAMLEEHDYARKREQLEKQADLATTQSERRKIELDILELAYQEKKQALDRIIANSKDAAAIEDARRDLLTLNANHTADRQSVINSTRNPIEEWAASVPKSAAEINEALQSIEANGIQGLSEALTGVITGTESLKSAFHNLAASILADLIQMTIKMLLFKALTAAFGGGSGGLGASIFPVSGGVDPLSPRALGGPVSAGTAYLVGERGPEIFMPKMGGSIIPNNKLNIGNDNSPSRSVSLTMNNDFRGADPGAVAGIKAHLDQLEASLPTRIIGTMSDARDRFVWRPR